MNTGGQRAVKFMGVLKTPFLEFINVIPGMMAPPASMLIKVGLTDKGGVVAGVADISHMAGTFGLCFKAVVPNPVLTDVLPGYQGGPCRHTQGRVGKAAVKGYALQSQAVQVWRDHRRVAHAAKRVTSMLIRKDKNDIGFICHNS